MKRKIFAAVSALVLLTSCAAEATNDRESGNGKDPDGFVDASRVTVARNADSVPNLVTFCAFGMKFIATLSGGDTGKDKSAQFMRLPEKDEECK